MAKIAPSSEATQKLEDQLICPVCLDQFTDPRALPCLHSFCIQCLKGLPLDPKEDGKQTLSCPTCRAEFDLPQQGVDAFHKAFHLNNLIEVHELMKKVNISGDKSTVCDHCMNMEAIGYCPQCNMFFCRSCNNVHSSWHQTSSHKLIGIDEVSSKTAQMVPIKPDPVINCSSHNRPLDIYCVSCDQPICYLCTIKDHKGHSQDLIPDAYQGSKVMIEEMLENLSQKIEDISEIKENLEANLQEIKENGDRFKKTINAAHDAMIHAIQKMKCLVLQSASSGLQSKQKFEEQQLETVDKFLGALQHCKEHTEHSLRVDTPIQLLVTKKHLLFRMNTLVESDECDSIEPLEEVEVDGEIPDVTKEELDEAVSKLLDESPKELFLRYSTEFYQQCIIEKDFPNSVIQFEESTASFTISFKGEPILVDKETIECSFRSVIEDDDEIGCTIDYSINDEMVKYQVNFTAINAGMYFFVLEIDDEEIESEKTYLTVLTT